MTIGCASLCMYDGPGVQAANDALWAAIADRLDAAGIADVPRRLDRARPLAAIWDDPALLLAQCCGYPLMTGYRGRLRYVATPRYLAAGCTGASYRSRLVVRRDDTTATLAGFRGRCAAINDRQSNSGMNLFRAFIAPLAGGGAFFSAVVETGAHATSVAAVATGTADIAAIDAVSFALLERSAPALVAKLRTLDWSAPSPGLPLVTSRHADDALLAALRDALVGIAVDPALAAVRATLLLDGFEVLAPSDYETILAAETAAAAAGYPVLA